MLESEGGHVSPISTAPDSKDAHSDGFASGETQIDRRKCNLKNSRSPSYCDQKSTYSSMVRVLYNSLVNTVVWKWYKYADFMHYCSVQPAVSHSSSMIGTQLNSLEDSGIKYC